MTSGAITSWQIDGGKVERVTDFIFLASKITADGDCSHEIKRRLLRGRKVMTKLDSILKSKKGLYSESYSFSNSHVWMWELDDKEGWVSKNWCLHIVRLLIVPWTALNIHWKEIKPVNLKGNQSWIFIGRTDTEAEAEAPILWPSDVKNWLIRKDPDAGKDWGQEEKGAADDWMASPTQWPWIWANSGRQWRTGKPGMRPWGHRVGHDWATKQQTTMGYTNWKWVIPMHQCWCNSGFKQAKNL